MSHFGVRLVSLICIQEVMYSGSYVDVKTAIRKSKSEILQKKISDCNGDQIFFSKLLTPC